MFNNNTFKTSMIFLGIITVVVIFSMFVNRNELFVKQDSANQSANANCIQDSKYC